ISDITLEKPTGTLTVDFPLVAAGAVLTAEVQQWLPVHSGTRDAPDRDAIEDVAVLALSGEPPEGSNAAPLIDEHDLWGHQFRAFGFPASYDAGVWARG